MVVMTTERLISSGQGERVLVQKRASDYEERVRVRLRDAVHAYILCAQYIKCVMQPVHACIPLF